MTDDDTEPYNDGGLIGGPHLVYDTVHEPVIGDFDHEGDLAKFTALQEKNIADAQRVSDAMTSKGLPDSKKPI